ncbi:hypothetical protein TWF694_008613 [Orbilia ellipsospora]|uniref:Uncharacterized protein n=1 Tax=Orbilia ellipsospora TaxID=2528407 RepID=A0AAV9XGP9_9PEZI
MSGSELSRSQCSADTSSSVDGSPQNVPHSSSSSSSFFAATAAPAVSDLATLASSPTTSTTSASATNLGSKPSASASRLLLEAPDTDFADQVELDLLPPLPPLNTDCEYSPAPLDTSSPRSQSPTAYTPTSSTSSRSSYHDTPSESVMPSHHVDSGGSSDTPELDSESSPSINLPLIPPEENTEWDPVAHDQTSSNDDGDYTPTISTTITASVSDAEGHHTASSHPITAAQDVSVDSSFDDDTDLSSDEDPSHDDHDGENIIQAYLESAAAAQLTNLYVSEAPGSALESNDQTQQQQPAGVFELPAAELSFGVFPGDNDPLVEFDFDSYLAQPDPMDLDNPTFNPTAAPENIPTITNIPQILLPPHIQPIPQQWLMNHPNIPFGIFQGNGNGFFEFIAPIDDDSPEWPGPQFHGEYERNLSFADFCNMLSLKYRHDPLGNNECKINPDFIEILNFHLPPELNRSAIDEDRPDYQGIPWKELDMERDRFRLLRNKKYSNYANLKPYPEPHRIPQLLPVKENYFRFRKTCNTVDVRFSHFQLRNVVSAVSKNDVFFTGDSTVIRIDPHTSETDTIMDLRKPRSGDPIKITSLASDHGVIIAGGFYGEYAMKSLDSPLDSRPVEGLVTTDSNGITNHVHFFNSRTTGTPRAVFSSNDEKLRILDCYQNKIVTEYRLPWAINCADTSPDGRLRVIVGDAKEVVIQDADNGETIHNLPGHLDFGFACAWSDDGHTIATGNQDMLVRVYDARNFKKEVAVLDAEIAGARSLRFTPVGSGPRVLAFAEPADMVSIVDAVTWETRQRIDFFGEIAGISFSPDGRDLYIANSDKMVGGLMQFERWKTGLAGYYGDDDGAGRYDEDYCYEAAQSRRRMMMRDVNMDYLGVI